MPGMPFGSQQIAMPPANPTPPPPGVAPAPAPASDEKTK
jgi:hypothetical protein